MYYHAKYIFNSPTSASIIKTILQYKPKLEKVYMHIKSKIHFALFSLSNCCIRNYSLVEAKRDIIFEIWKFPYETELRVYTECLEKKICREVSFFQSLYD